MNKISYFLNLFKRSFWEYKFHMVVLTALGVLSGIFGGIGVNALIPAFSLAIGAGNAGDDFVSRNIEKLFAAAGIELTIASLLLFIILLFILKAAVSILFSYINTSITSRYSEKTRNRVLYNFLRARWPFLMKQKLGHLERILMVNVDQSTSLLAQIGYAIMSFSNLLVYTAVAVNISLPITAMTFVFGVLVFFGLMRPLTSRVRAFSSEAELINRQVAHSINQSMLGLKSIQASGAGEEVAKGAANYFGGLRSLNVRSNILNIFTGMLIEPLGIIFISGVFAYSYYTSADFNIAALATVIYLIRQIFLYIEQVYTHVLGFTAKAPYVEILLKHEEDAIKEKEEDAGFALFIFINELMFTGVDFAYEGGASVLKGADFAVRKGEFVGIIGPSGAGKTTIVDLILRLLNPSGGCILLDGKDISTISMKEWRRNIGYVSQDIFLMNDTISNNIRFFDSSITDEKIAEAVKMANIYDFIMELPEKFDTVVGERGVLLSGGQRQRLIIARVLARKPQLLILDEATSALDSESEIKIQKVIENLKGKITVIVIAHRLSTLMNSDKILSLKDGKIAESGSPKELLKNKESYFFKVYNIRE